MHTLANLITVTRLLLVIPVIVCYLTPFPYHGLIAAGLFALAALLDWLDGFVARTRKEETSIGAALDHTADKILISMVLIAITYQQHNLIITICSMLILSRELLISGLREHMSDQGQRGLVRVGWLGKVKTALQMMTVLLLLASEPIALPVVLGEVLMILVALVTLISAWDYLSGSKNILLKGDDK